MIKRLFDIALRPWSEDTYTCMDYALTLQPSAQKTSEESRKVNLIWYRPLLKMACYLEIIVFDSALYYCDKKGGQVGQRQLWKDKGVTQRRKNIFLQLNLKFLF